MSKLKNILAFIPTWRLKLEAKKWLNFAREVESTGSASGDIKIMRKHLEKAGKGLEDIGTSEEELENFFTSKI